MWSKKILNNFKTYDEKNSSIGQAVQKLLLFTPKRGFLE